MTNWTPLKTELAIWQEQGLSLPFWWRDDDAIAPSAEIETLLKLSQDTNFPVHIAVIPNGANQQLADRLADAPQAVPILHGFAHINHAPAGKKKSEFGSNRPNFAIKTDFQMGLSKLQKLFGQNLAPLFVPPWNRIASEHLPELATAGLRAVSTFTPRKQASPCKGLVQINTHIDPIDWHGTRSAHPAEMLIAQTVALLQQRRNSTLDNAEPLGYLTHHLVHDTAIWDFTAGFIETMVAGPITPWNAHSLKGPKI